MILLLYEMMFESEQQNDTINTMLCLLWKEFASPHEARQRYLKKK